MAINFRAGLEEVEKSGQIAGQGFAQLTQLAQQRGNIVSQGITQRKAMEAQNQQAKRQENQQMFEAVTGAATTFANIKMNSDKLERQKAEDAIRQDEHKWKTQDRAALEEARIGSQKAYVKRAQEMGLDTDDTMTDAQLAAQVQAMDLAEESKVNLSLKKTQEKKMLADMVNDEKKIAAEEKRNKILAEANSIAQEGVAVQEANDIANKLKERVKSTTNPDSYYANMDPTIKKEQDLGAKALIAASAEASKFADISGEYASMFNLKRNAEGKYDTQAIINSVQKARDLPPDDPRRFKLKMLEAKLFVYGRMALAGQGSISDRESLKAVSAVGGGAFDNIDEFSQMTDEQKKMLDKVEGMAVKAMSSEGAVQALLEEMDKKTRSGQTKIATEFVKNGGFYTKNPEQRAAMLYDSLPTAKKNQIQMADFAKLKIEDQAAMAIGENAAKSMSSTWEKVHRIDALAMNPSEQLEAIEREANSISFNRKGLSADSAQAIKNRFVTDVMAYTNRYRGVIEDAPGTKAYATSKDTPTVIDGGKPTPVRTYNNIVPAYYNKYDANPNGIVFDGKGMIRPPNETGNASVGGGAVTHKQPRRVKISSFGGEK